MIDEFGDPMLAEAFHGWVGQAGATQGTGGVSAPSVNQFSRRATASQADVQFGTAGPGAERHGKGLAGDGLPPVIHFSFLTEPSRPKAGLGGARPSLLWLGVAGRGEAIQGSDESSHFRPTVFKFVATCREASRVTAGRGMARPGRARQSKGQARALTLVCQSSFHNLQHALAGSGNARIGAAGYAEARWGRARQVKGRAETLCSARQIFQGLHDHQARVVNEGRPRPGAAGRGSVRRGAAGCGRVGRGKSKGCWAGDLARPATTTSNKKRG